MNRTRCTARFVYTPKIVFTILEAATSCEGTQKLHAHTHRETHRGLSAYTDIEHSTTQTYGPWCMLEHKQALTHAYTCTHTRMKAEGNVCASVWCERMIENERGLLPYTAMHIHNHTMAI